MTRLHLGPGDLAASLDHDFFLPREALAQLQLYAHQAVSLPTDAEELRESIIGTAPGETPEADDGFFPASDLEPLATVFGDMAEHAQRWQHDVHPGVVATAHLVSQYAVKTSRLYQTLAATIGALQRDPFDPVPRRRLQRLSERLTAEAARGVEITRAVLDDLALFMRETQADAQALARATAALKSDLDIEDEQVERLDEQLAAAEAELARANRRYTTAAIVAATTPTYRIVGIFLGPIGLCIADVGTVVVSAVYTTEALKAKVDIEAALAEIELLTTEKIAAIRLRAALRLATAMGVEIGAAASAVQPAMAAASDMWRQLAEDLARLRAAAADDPASIPLIYRGAELEASRLAWQRLGQAADEFRAHAFIRVLPPEEDATKGSEKAAPSADRGAAAPSEVTEDAR